MSPDKVVGLRSWPGIPHSDVLFPVSGKTSLLLPFLVVEAKSEQGGPGFRAIQNQTAFPIRRLLKAQKDLIGHDPLAEPCLVWFFAYQGEVWRLHMCTHDDKRVVSSNAEATLGLLLTQESREYMIYGKERFSRTTALSSYCCSLTTYGPGLGISTDR